MQKKPNPLTKRTDVDRGLSPLPRRKQKLELPAAMRTLPNGSILVSGVRHSQIARMTA